MACPFRRGSSDCPGRSPGAQAGPRALLQLQAGECSGGNCRWSSLNFSSLICIESTNHGSCSFVQLLLGL